MRHDVVLQPGIHGPSLRWYHLDGFLLLLVRCAWRFFVTGRPLWGRGDNATFLRDATKDYRGGPVERLSRARWRRLAWRWVVLGIPWALADCYILIGPPYGLILVVYAGVATASGAYLGVHTFRMWWPVREYRKTYIYPAWRVLTASTGTRYRRRDALAGIQLPAGWGTEAVEDPVRVYLPDVALPAGTKRQIVESVGARLGLPGATAKWTEGGVERVLLELLPAELPPARVTLASLLEELDASPLEEPVVGLASKGRVVRMDFRNDSPHTLGSAGSGAGKSTLYKFVAMQRMRRGAYAIILDFKKWSHLRWAGKLPGRVVILDEIRPIHDMLGRVLDELLWRKSFDLHQEDELASLPTLDVYVEEINTLMAMLVEFWKAEVARLKQEARTALRHAKEAEDEDAIQEAEEALAAANGLPRTSPAVQALRWGVNLGREFRIHFHFIGQSMSAQAAGGRDTRESFRTRLLARWDAKTWKMLADGVPFIACPSGSVGIWAHVHGAEVDIVRVPYVADEDAVEYVLKGTRPALPMFHGDPSPDLEVAVQPEALPLRELAELAEMSLEALRSASKRPGFPMAIEGTGGAGKVALYDPEEVMAWARSR